MTHGLVLMHLGERIYTEHIVLRLTIMKHIKEKELKGNFGLFGHSHLGMFNLWPVSKACLFAFLHSSKSLPQSILEGQNLPPARCSALYVCVGGRMVCSFGLRPN